MSCLESRIELPNDFIGYTAGRGGGRASAASEERAQRVRAVKLKYSKMCEGLRHNCRSPCFSRIFISGRGEKLVVGWLKMVNDKLFSSKRE